VQQLMDAVEDENVRGSIHVLVEIVGPVKNGGLFSNRASRQRICDEPQHLLTIRIGLNRALRGESAGSGKH
jgi:hypothetical protein